MAKDPVWGRWTGDGDDGEYWCDSWGTRRRCSDDFVCCFEARQIFCIRKKNEADTKKKKRKECPRRRDVSLIEVAIGRVVEYFDEAKKSRSSAGKCKEYCGVISTS